VAAINTIQSVMGIDLDTLRPQPAVEGYTTPGGYSYKAVKPIALAKVRHGGCRGEGLWALLLAGPGGGGWVSCCEGWGRRGAWRGRSSTGWSAGRATPPQVQRSGVSLAPWFFPTAVLCSTTGNAR
jgi:hypothetical protein